MKTEYLLHREVEHVLAALMPVNRVVMRVCIHTGLRVGDVLALRTDQIALLGYGAENQKAPHCRASVGFAG